jgi:hypothetical protein
LGENPVLNETAGIEQQLNPFTASQLSTRMLSFDRSGATHLQSFLLGLGKLADLPQVFVAHSLLPSSLRNAVPKWRATRDHGAN